MNSNLEQQIQRITYYESILQQLEDGEYSPEKLRELEAYYTGDEWKQDFAADEAGLLPRDLKRGVLSEDGIYNVLERYKESKKMSKVLLILVDGMRPDAIKPAGHPFADEMLAHGTHFLSAQTVMPSVTLPCHMSLFHSVSPDRHGILTNTYVPQVRPVKGLCEVLRAAGKNCGFFYNWEELRDLTRPDALTASYYVSGHIYGYEEANRRVTLAAKEALAADAPDFAFVYLGWTDSAGHSSGWMSEEYIHSVRESWGSIETLCRDLPDDYLVIVTADHGGHGRSHGSEMPEDMTIPVFCYNRNLPAAQKDGGSIMDIAPTICEVLGVPADPEWEGHPLPIEK